MTTPDHRNLIDLMDEYGHGLSRIAGEKELLKLIEQRALVELNQPIKAFKLVATARWRDEARVTREELGAQIDLFDLMENADLSRVPETGPNKISHELRLREVA